MRDVAQSIVETVQHPLLILDQQLRARKGNAAFYSTFGTQKTETEGRLVYDLGGGQWDLPRLRTSLDAVTRNGEPFQDVEVEHDFPNIGRKVMLLDGHRVVDASDGSPMVLLAFEDVTDRVRVREELGRLNCELESRVAERTAQLEAANKELEAFSYSVSHDLRAPLRALDGFSDELLRSYPGKVLDNRGQHYLRRLRLGTQRMGQLIDDMLLLSRLNRDDLRRSQVDFSALAGEVAAELLGRESDRRVTINIEPGMFVEGDSALLRVALENLLGNAFKFTSKLPVATVAVRRTVTEHGTTFYVRDEGQGSTWPTPTSCSGRFSVCTQSGSSLATGWASLSSSESSTATAGWSGPKADVVGDRRFTSRYLRLRRHEREDHSAGRRQPGR